jgi:subtilase family serine protease
LTRAASAAVAAALALLAVACSTGDAPATAARSRVAALLAAPLASTLAPKPPPVVGCFPGARCYGPPQLYRAYDLLPVYRAGNFGQGETVAVLDAFGSPTIRRDVAAFDAAFHLPPVRLRVAHPVGAPPPFRATPERTGWAHETSIDVEWVHAMAPSARIVLVETPVDETEGIHGMPEMMRSIAWARRTLHPDVFSLSFTATEETFPAGAVARLRRAIVAASRSGATVVAATGDSGAAGYRLDLPHVFRHPAVGWPATDPLVTAVGGTDPLLDAAGRRLRPDTAWPLSGGGRSRLFARPAYQSTVAPGPAGPRLIPDVAIAGAVQDGELVLYDGRWLHGGGTSMSAALFAGIVALADRAAGHPLGNLNPRLYRLAAAGDGAIVDVRSGSNGFAGVSGYAAGPGYDLVTGLGTVDAARLVRALAR